MTYKGFLIKEENGIFKSFGISCFGDKNILYFSGKLSEVKESINNFLIVANVKKWECI